MLFVDDELNVRAGLQRMLRGMREVWAMRFAGSGQEALEMMRATPPDVVVSDMRMPGMDGRQLLTEVERLFPRTVRVILSGQCDEETAVRTVSGIHIFLSKPCNTNDLIDAVSRALRLRALCAEPRVAQAVSALQRQPALPPSYYEFIRAIRLPETKPDRLAHIIEQDSDLTARLLQLVNAPPMALARELTDPAEAMQMLGIDLFQSLVLTSGVAVDLAPQVTAPEPYDHAVRAAVLSRDLAHELGLAKHQVASSFSAGLLHDLGLLVFTALLSEPRIDIAEALRQEDRSSCERERGAFGADHAELGAYLLSLWGLPDATVEAVAFHHQPTASEVRQPSVIAVVHAASALADSHDGAPPDLDEGYLQQVGILPIVTRWQAASRRVVVPRA
ncbi:MAG: HDOD domain-containing protein [Proteobacteria bacterium]|nr:HDOD domain-containing protein [Pseudomonadota bacterium]